MAAITAVRQPKEKSKDIDVILEGVVRIQDSIGISNIVCMCRFVYVHEGDRKKKIALIFLSFIF